MQLWLITMAHNHALLIYFFVIIFAFLEGPFLSMVSGALIRFGYLDFIPMYISLMLGDLIGDVFWYYLGFRFGYRFVRRFGKYVGIDEEKVERVKTIFHKYKHSILFISKVTNGFGFALATLTTAGMVRIPFRRYIAMNVLGQFVWTGLLIGAGYFFSTLYIEVNTILGRIFVVALFALVLVIFMRYRAYLQKQTMTQ